jgi:hypothetical protein
MNDEAVCRTAAATPGLLNIYGRITILDDHVYKATGINVQFDKIW